jgi:hypothetical protein
MSAHAAHARIGSADASFYDKLNTFGTNAP